MKHIIENCGNFSEEVLKGLIGYGREIEKGRGRQQASAELPRGDGYATKEADILLGGFIRLQASQRAVRSGTLFSALDLKQKERLAVQISEAHLKQHGTVGREHYQHWMVRVRVFAKHQKIGLPRQNALESDYQYFRRIRKWVESRNEKWPELRPGAGTHIVLSPDPKVWRHLRSNGVDERLYLRAVLAETMKEFSDWRRKQFGKGRTLGWVAGTHVQANGADRHPHIHLVVLKRDSAGHEVDWSVSSLKGHRPKDDPDPLKELKRIFSKKVEKEFEKRIGQSARVLIPNNRQRLRQLFYGLRTVFRVMQGYQSLSLWPPNRNQNEIGSMLRFVALARAKEKRRSFRPEIKPLPTLSVLSQKVRQTVNPPSLNLER